MSGRLVSPVFAGREREFAALIEVYEQVSAGESRSVLLGGEAGGGKSRLVHEFLTTTGFPAATDAGTRRAATGTPGPAPHVLVGGCLELGSAGLPYAPFTAALRQLVRERGAAEVAGLLPAGAAADLAGLLPEFGEPPADPDAGTARARLFERMLSLMERLAEQRPLIWVVEDAHWADRSTRDLLVFLVRNLPAGPLLLIITYRSDELHRTHPLRPVLAELHRVEGVRRIELSRLTRDEVAAQLEGITGQPPTLAMRDKVSKRAEGIPLFVEAMVDADGTVHRSLPASLRDLLVAAVRRLPEPTQQVLRVATATERPGHALLAAVTGLDDAALSDALRPAVAANVLVVSDDPAGGYAFRHALIREAIRAELLPGEHVRVHRRYAEALEADPALRTGDRPSVELALHWYAAHDAERALPAAWTAAADSATTYAYGEQLQMYERVLELWERVPAAAERIGADHTRVLERAAEAALNCGDVSRGLAFARAALSELDEKREPARVALLLLLRAKLRGDSGVPGALADLRRAEQLVPEPSVARLRVLIWLSGALMLSSAIDLARPFTEEALGLAHDMGEAWAEAHALITLGLIDDDRHAALTMIERGLEKAERAGSHNVAIRALINISAVLMELGDNERAARSAYEALTRAKPLGQLRARGAFAADNLAEARSYAGRWDEALETLLLADRLGPVPGRVGILRTRRARIALARGDTQSAESAIEAAGNYYEDADPFPQETLPFAEVLIEHFLARGDAAGALAAAEQALEEDFPAGSTTGNTMYAWSFLATAMRVCALAGTHAMTEAESEPTECGDHPESRQRPASGEHPESGQPAAGAEPVGPAAPAPWARRTRALREELVRHAARLRPNSPVSAAHRLTFLAEAADAAALAHPPEPLDPPETTDVGEAVDRPGTTDTARTADAVGAGRVAPADAWERAVAAWAELDRPYNLAYASHRAARAVLDRASDAGQDAARAGTRGGAAGQDAARAAVRDLAAGHLRRAAELAEGLGARPLLARVRRLARRAGIALEPRTRQPRPAGGARFGLTPRELEVLRLVAEGKSNREIAEKLFITAKTASVHVSNILAKLKVTSRGEAAAAAHRARLFDLDLTD